jgi:hypothetical protein
MITYWMIPTAVAQSIPECGADREIPEYALADLGRFLCALVRDARDSEMISRCSSMLDELARGEPDVQNAVIVGAFEAICDEGECVEYVLRFLRPRTRFILRRTQLGWWIGRDDLQHLLEVLAIESHENGRFSKDLIEVVRLDLGDEQRVVERIVRTWKSSGDPTLSWAAECVEARGA